MPPPGKPLVMTITTLLRSATRPVHLHQLHAAMIKASLFPHHALPTARLLASPLAPLPYVLSLFAAIPCPTLFHHTALLRVLSTAPSFPSAASASLAILVSARVRLPALDVFAFQSIDALCAKNPRDDTAASLGRQVHALLLQYRFSGVVSLGNALCHFYCYLENMAAAQRMFDEMSDRDAMSWNMMIGSYVRAGEICATVDMFGAMRCSGVDASSAAVVALVGFGWRGESVHGFGVKTGLCKDVKVAASMEGMYFRKSDIGCAKKVFEEATRRDLVLYNCMVDSCAKAVQIEGAMALVHRMIHEGVRPSTGTLMGVLSVCGASGA